MNQTMNHPPYCHCETCNANGNEHCECVVQNREEGESQRDWLKRWMCMHHWMQTNYYRNKFDLNKHLEDSQ